MEVIISKSSEMTMFSGRFWFMLAAKSTLNLWFCAGQPIHVEKGISNLSALQNVLLVLFMNKHRVLV